MSERVTLLGDDRVAIRRICTDDQEVYRFDAPDALPALLAEYGRLAAELSTADPERVEQLHERLHALDELIDQQVALLGTTRL